MIMVRRLPITMGLGNLPNGIRWRIRTTIWSEFILWTAKLEGEDYRLRVWRLPFIVGTTKVACRTAESASQRNGALSFFSVNRLDRDII